MRRTATAPRTRGRAEREALLAREQVARGQAEAAARARDQFLAVVSHELRSPLNGIQSWAHVAEQQVREPSPVFRRAMAGIRTGIEQQVRLIEDLLDATRILSGQLRLTRRPCALRPVLDTALESIRPAARAKRVRLHADLKLSSEQVLGDPDRLQQILWNLLDNAIKFTGDEGGVWVTASVHGHDAVITVRDNGRGIRAEFLPLLFDRFRQADASSTRRHEGLGLGLALVRHIAELHGGSVRGASAGHGRGATFTLRLPLRPSLPVRTRPRASGARAALPSLSGSHVLVVDDQHEAREALAALLGHAGARVTTADSCAQAMARLQRAPPGDLPHVLLCDIAMPEEDGYVTLRRIREWEGRRRLAPMAAIALTAFAQREDRIRALSSGFRLYLTKPAAPDQLVSAVAMSRHTGAQPRGTRIAGHNGAAQRGGPHESARRDDDGRPDHPGGRERGERREGHARAGHRLPAGGAGRPAGRRADRSRHRAARDRRGA